MTVGPERARAAGPDLHLQRRPRSVSDGIGMHAGALQRLTRVLGHRLAPDEQTVAVEAQPASLRELVAGRKHAVLHPRAARGAREQLVAVSRQREQRTRALEEDQRAHALLFIV